MMHEGINPNVLLKNVIKDKNMQFEIFLILSQTKPQKIKNNIISNPKVPISKTIALIDERFRWIQNQAHIKYMKSRGISEVSDEVIEKLHKSE